MAKHNHFTSVMSAEVGERIPKVAGAWNFALPYLMDDSVTWANYFSGIEPRAFLVAEIKTGLKAGQVRPLNLTVVNGADAAAAAAEAALFIGLAVEGTDYINDPNMTVHLAGGIPAKYAQQNQTLPAYAADPAIISAVTAGKIPGLKLVKGHLFWNTIQ